MSEDYLCGLCWEWICVNTDGTEDVCRLTHPGAEIDVDEHECIKESEE
ncbi:unnamed protein product [marine sediment metagenome]|uniref:Uncharacterized protein n=1 Tax=marine sediment metagenome TaxID=412755 RepID=X0VD56_9ZZZZ